MLLESGGYDGIKALLFDGNQVALFTKETCTVPVLCIIYRQSTEQGWAYLPLVSLDIFVNKVDEIRNWIQV